MGKHRVPRWMNLLWLIFVFSLTIWFITDAVRRGCGFVETLGFVGANAVLIFMVAVIVGLVLYGLSILLEGPEAHKSHSDDDDPPPQDMANFVP